MKIEFDGKIQTGIQEIDDQHRRLIGIYNELDAAFEKGRAHRHMSEILARLFQYTKEHFAAEETILEACDYPHLAQHQHEHAHLSERLRAFVVRYRRGGERISAEVVEFVRQWVVDHIMDCDHAYVQHVRAHPDVTITEPVGVED